MRLYTRHLLKSFLSLFALCFFSAVLVFVVIDFVGNSRVWLSRPPQDRYQYYLNYLPYIAYLVCPIALLLASVFSVGRLAKQLELVALRAAGVSLSRLMLGPLAVGLCLTGALFVFQDKVLPDANHRRFAINAPGEDAAGDSKERFSFLYTGEDGVRVYFQYYAGTRREGENVTALKLRNGVPVFRADAMSMRWDADSGWMLSNGKWRDFAGDSVRAATFARRRFVEFRDKPDELLDDRIYPDEMSMAELGRRAAALKRSGEPASVFLTHWHFRVASAWVNFFMVLMGVALAANAVRSGLARNFGIALGITFLYYVALRLGLVMGESGSLSPVAAAWFGNLVFAPLGAFLWWRASRV